MLGGSNSKRKRTIHRLRTELVVLMTGVLVWELLARWLNFELFPPFSAVLESWINLWQSGAIPNQLAASLQSLVLGYSAAVVVGLSLGTAMGLSRKVAYFFDPLIDINLATPTLVYVPILFAIFGINDITRTLIVFIYSVFIIAVNTTAGIHSVDISLVEMAQSFNASRWQILRRIVLPDALPMIMSGLRIGMNRAVKGMINGELLIALTGLGASLRFYGGSFQVDKVLAILLTIIVLAVILSSLLQALDRYLNGWAETTGRV